MTEKGDEMNEELKNELLAYGACDKLAGSFAKSTTREEGQEICDKVKAIFEEAGGTGYTWEIRELKGHKRGWTIRRIKL